MAIPLAIGLGVGFGVENKNLKSKVRNRDRDIANLKTENQALRDQLDSSQNPQNGNAPWSNLLNFPQLNYSYQQQQQPANQMLGMASQLMQLLGQGMGNMPQYNAMVGPQLGNLGNTNPNVQNLFSQMQNLMQLSGGLYNAVQAYDGLQRQNNPFGGQQPQYPQYPQVPQFPQGPQFQQNPGFGFGPGVGMPQQQPGFGQTNMPTYGQPLVPTYAQPNNDRATITTLGKYASKLFPQGKMISMADMQRIAQGGRCPDGTEAPADLKMACQAMASNPQLFDKLQSSVRASKGKTDTDGLATVYDLQTLMKQMKEANPNSTVSYNTNTPSYNRNSAYGSSFVNALMGHLQSTGVNPFLLNMLQQPSMQQPFAVH